MSALAHGVVEVTRGPHQGKVGYYDDEEVGGAVVYFEEPFSGPMQVIPIAWLRPSDARHLPLEKWLREHPDLARQMGENGRRRLGSVFSVDRMVDGTLRVYESA